MNESIISRKSALVFKKSIFLVSKLFYLRKKFALDMCKLVNLLDIRTFHKSVVYDEISLA